MMLLEGTPGCSPGTGGPRLSPPSGGHAPPRGTRGARVAGRTRVGGAHRDPPPQASTRLLIMLVRKPPEVKESTNRKMRRKSTTWKILDRKTAMSPMENTQDGGKDR